MKRGDKTRCPHCGQDTILKEKPVMDGWTQVGLALVCTLCGKKIADPAATEAPAATDRKAVSGLAALLQTEEETKPVLTATEDEKRFCKDCKFFVNHPFVTRCSRHDRPVDSMDDCPEFVRNPSTPKE